jgi:surfeit locus 1 family protein
MTEKPWGWPRVRVLLLAAAGILLTAYLGFWQLGRAADKQALQASKSAQASQDVLDGRSLGGSGDSVEQRAQLLHRSMVLTGQWLAQHTIYLDNRQMNGKPGFFVLTPMRLEGAPVVVLVQRGWVQRVFTSKRLRGLCRCKAIWPHGLQGSMTLAGSNLGQYGKIST